MCVNSDDGNLCPINMQYFTVLTDLEKIALCEEEEENSKGCMNQRLLVLNV